MGNWFSSGVVLFAAPLFALAGAPLALLPGRWGRALPFAGVGLAGASALAGGVWHLHAGAHATLQLPNLLQFGPLALRADATAALFLCMLGAVSLGAALFAPAYLEHHASPRRGRWLAFVSALFVAGMALMFLAADVVVFLFAWEAMTLASYFLVVADHDQEASRRAGLLYFIVAQAGAACVAAALFIVAASSGSLAFDLMSAAALSRPARAAVFVLALVGFGAKAGLVPLHLWLPAAHPAAPAFASALLSGVMIKAGLYGMLRLLAFTGPGPMWWGLLVIAAGAVTALLGILYALAERDLKRLLAYSSVENMGVIFVALGGAMTFHAVGRPEAGALAGAAALLHALGHSVFKGLLFLGSGAVQHGAGTRDLELLGGLHKTMPRTAGLFLLGAFAIAALPPLSGFMSEWLAVRALLAGATAPAAAVRIAAPLAAAAVALAAGLAAACFVKAYAGAFLALPRSDEAAQAKEAPPAMLGGMLFLVFAALLVSYFAAPAAQFAAAAAAPALGRATLSPGWALVPAVGPGAAHPLAIAAAAGAFALLGWALTTRAPAARVAPPWACGAPALTPRMAYSPGAIAKPLRMVFAKLYRSERRTRLVHDGSPYFPRGAHFESTVRPLSESEVLHPIAELVLAVSHRMRAFQTGSLHAYLAYLFIALLALLFFAR
jgi:hydrogenase-4 component B